MTDQDVRETLEKLYQEIDLIEVENEDTKSILANMKADIRLKLDETDLEERPSLQERLQENLVHFEVTHPGLSAALNAALSILGNAGV